MIGVLVVAVLIAAFVFGCRVQEGVTPPAPHEHPRRPLTDRLPGETSERRRPVAVPRLDRGQRLRPHQLRGRTERISAEEH